MASIHYIVSRWGEPTQTFVRREWTAVRDLGIAVDQVSLKQPVGDARHLSAREVVAGFGRAMLRRPRRTLSIVSTVRRASLANLVPMLVSTVVGIAWSERGWFDGSHLHSHFGWVAGAATRAAALYADRPYSVVYHAFDLHKDRFVDGFAAQVAADADVCFVVAERDVEILEQRFGVTPQLLRMGVSDDWPAPPARTGDPGNRSIVSVGSLTPKKGHRVLIDAVAELAGSWKLTIVGAGPLREELQAHVDARGAAGYVSLVGAEPIETVRTRLENAAVFALGCVVLPNGDRDGVPVAIMEAMALGLPVVTTAVGGIEELVDERCGRVVAPGDAVALAKAISELEDPALRLQLGTIGHERIRDGWLTSRSAETIAGLL